MKTIITTTNTKLGHMIPSINIPTTVCRADAPCRKGCYAKKGNWLFKGVQKGLQERLDLFIHDSDKYFDTIISELNGLTTYKYVRWHSSGEIVNYKYLLGIVKVAKACKQTNFLCFTKKFDIVNLYLSLGHRIPKNLHIVFSGWDKNFIVDNPYNMPMTYVVFKDKSMNANIPETAIPCAGHCETCLACWTLQNGQSVYFHKH